MDVWVTNNIWNCWSEEATGVAPHSLPLPAMSGTEPGFSHSMGHKYRAHRVARNLLWPWASAQTMPVPPPPGSSPWASCQRQLQSRSEARPRRRLLQFASEKVLAWSRSGVLCLLLHCSFYKCATSLNPDSRRHHWAVLIHQPKVNNDE